MEGMTVVLMGLPLHEFLNGLGDYRPMQTSFHIWSKSGVSHLISQSKSNSNYSVDENNVIYKIGNYLSEVRDGYVDLSVLRIPVDRQDR